MGKITKVDGIESFARRASLDTSVELRRCPMCDAMAAFSESSSGLHDPFLWRAQCTNTSCGIATPYHYKTQADAAYAWNRRPGDPPKRVMD